MYWANEYSSIQINTSHPNIGWVENLKWELSQKFLNALNTEQSPIHLHDAPIQTMRKNPYDTRLVWIFWKAYSLWIKDSKLVIGIPSSAEIYGPQRDITRIWKEAREALFETNDSIDREGEIARILQPLNSAYALAKQVFEWKFRQIPDETWMKLKYFKHLKWAASNVISLSLEETDRHERPEIYVERIVIGFLHDIMEDIKISFKTLEETFWSRVALWVLAISKDPWEDFIPSKDTESLKVLGDYKWWFVYKDDEEYQKVVRKYKWIRNKSYFKHFVSFDAFKENMRILAHEQWMSIKENELDELALNSILSKFADRIDNLKTEWDPNNTNKVRRKVDETKKYFLPITKEVCSKAHDMMVEEIIKLEELLSWNQLFEERNGWDDFEKEKDSWKTSKKGNRIWHETGKKSPTES